MPIYTKTGDRGTTALFGGKRVLKCHDLVDVYGSIDELNSWIGYLISLTTQKKIRLQLSAIQKDLFVVGSTFAGWKGMEEKILDSHIREMEKTIDASEIKLPKINNFILPGGEPLAALFHITRSIARRSERQVVKLSRKEQIPEIIIKYLNRLSDLLFILSRVINNDAGIKEETWKGK